MHANPKNVPETDLPKQALSFRVQLYGMLKHRNLFTPRQLTALVTISDLILKAREKALIDASNDSMHEGESLFKERYISSNAYADAIATYLAIALDKGANYWSSICSWHSGRDTVTSTFGRQAIPMVWDYAEAN